MSRERRRDDPQASWNSPVKAKARKNTRRWCRGKFGVEHQVEVTLDVAAYGAWIERGCRWFVYNRVTPAASSRYLCYHIEQCQECGRKMGPIPRTECPDYRELAVSP